MSLPPKMEEPKIVLLSKFTLVVWYILRTSPIFRLILSLLLLSFCLSKSSFRPTVPYCAGFFCFLHFFPFQNFLALFSLSLFLYNRTNFQRFQTCFSSGKLVGKVLSMNAGRGMCMSRSRMLVWCVRCPSRVLSGPIHISGAGFIRPVTSRETRFRGQTHFLCMEHVLFPLSFLI